MDALVEAKQVRVHAVSRHMQYFSLSGAAVYMAVVLDLLHAFEAL